MKIMINSGRISPFFTTRLQLLNKIKDSGYDVTLGGFDTSCIEKCQNWGAEFAEIPFARAGMNPIQDAKTLRAYYRVMKEGQFDIVHSYTAKPNIYGSIAAKWAGIKKIYPTVNGLGYAFTGNSTKNKMVRAVICVLYKWAFSGATKVFFQNNDDAAELVRRGVLPQEKCVVIASSGIDLKAFPYSEIYQVNTFFLATRLLITKGVRTYFEAAKIVKEKHPEAKFYLAGSLDPNPDGIKKDELDQYVQDGTVEYLGVVKDMPAALKEYAVFVLPSYYREGVPHAILEAMSIGRAIVTTDAPGCKETVNGKNGFLIEPRNSEQLAEKMIWMLDHPSEVKRMGAESRKYAEEKFDVEIVNRVMLETMGIK